MKIELKVQERNTGTADSVRHEGFVPAVVYGKKQEPISIQVERVHFDKVRQEAGESSIVTLIGLNKDIEVLINDISFDPVKGGVQHADFYAIEAGKELTTNVPLNFVGESPAVKHGAILTKVLHEIEVTCKPNDLPHGIDVDISVLADVGDQLHVGDLKLGSGVTVENDPEDVVATISEASEEEEETVDTTIDMDAIEVEKTGKEEETEEEEAK